MSVGVEHWEKQLEQAQEEVANAEKARLEAEQREQAAKQRVVGLEKIVSGMKDMEAADRTLGQARLPVDATANGTRPRGQEAVKRLLREYGAMTIDELLDEIVRRGWIEESAQYKRVSVANAIRRLSKAGEVEPLGSGYRLVEDGGREK